MAKSTDRIYWDACAWIALIQREKIRVNGALEDREALCRPVIKEAEKGKIEIVTSYLCFAEVCKHPEAKSSQEDKIAAYFEHEYILGVPVDRVIGENARKLIMSGLSGLKPPDAIHVASAALANVREMHTFDKTLLGLTEKVLCQDGRILRIVKPNLPLPPAPLLEEAKH
jgi:predicted nucleic acid-binding protein